MPRHSMAIATAVLAVVGPACTARDAPVPWDTSAMVNELMLDLRRFEGITATPRDVDVLAWRTSLRIKEHTTPAGLPPVASRTQSASALLWGRFEAKDGTPEWLVIQAYRSEEGWQRPFINTHYMSRPPRLRPGERLGGTWPGFIKYSKPPTSKEICDFARVDYLAVMPPVRQPIGERDDSRVEERGGVRARTWQRVTGEEPACSGWER